NTITAMTFLDLLDGVEALGQSGNPHENPTITGVEYDSRRVKPGNVFVAMQGGSSDGNRFIDQAIAAGAVAIVTDAHQTPRFGVAWAREQPRPRHTAGLTTTYYRLAADE